MRSRVLTPTVALVYGALSCMTVGGFRKHIIVGMQGRAEHDTVRVQTGFSGPLTPVEEHAHTD